MRLIAVTGRAGVRTERFSVDGRREGATDLCNVHEHYSHWRAWQHSAVEGTVE